MTAPLDASKVLMKNGMVLEGALAPIPSMVNRPDIDQGPVEGGGRIVVVNDNLRRTYVGFNNVREVREGDAGEVFERINLTQPVATVGRQVYSMGPIVRTTKWDRFGRRILTMQGEDGPVNVIQGITQITPVWTKVEALRGGPGPQLLLDQRIATSGIPPATLTEILSTVIDRNNPDQRLKLVRFFLQAEQYNEAQRELEEIVGRFPEFAGLERELDNMRQLRARRGLDELMLRRTGGQHRLARWLLENFPAENIAAETLFEVRRLLGEYEEIDRRGTEVVAQQRALLEQLDDSDLRHEFSELVEEIAEELSVNTLERMASFRRLVDDGTLGPAEKLSLGISGWLLGSDDATDNSEVVSSLVRVRRLIGQFMNAPTRAERDRIAAAIRSEEGGRPRDVAQLIRHMKPPLDPGEPDPSINGLFRLRVPGLAGTRDVTYLVQVPPEYDPHRIYPAVLSLHGAGTDSGRQIDWWAGGPTESGGRLGQGSRHSYIVIAPDWAEPGQRNYGYSAREHAAVLDTLRDACRRFSIDTDRVFLSGHSMGGDAVWDIGLAHPDLWAGVIPIVAQADSASYNYIARYWENARHVPLYFVTGELDGRKAIENAPQFDRYLPRLGFDCTVVEYLGRGHEHFQDEVQRLFEWMSKQKRNFFPEEFTCSTMRSWDNFFWWLELSQLPPQQVVNPPDWPPPRGFRAMQVSGRIRKSPEGDAAIYVRSSAGVVTIWLSPQLVDFTRRTRVMVGTRSYTGPAPDVAVILDDVRTRGDRLHPFWAKLEINGP